MQSTYFGAHPGSRGRPKSAHNRPNSFAHAMNSRYAGAYKEAATDARRRLALSAPSERFAQAKAVRALTPHLERADSTIPVPVKVRLAFEAFDRNRSGNLNNRELRNALRHYGFDVSSRQSAGVLAAYDDNPNGKLDIDEFAHLVSDLQSGVIRANAAPALEYEKLNVRVRRAFAAFDTNRSGLLDYRELRNALRHYGLDATARGAARVLAAYDSNPDGKMDVVEFARLIADLDSGHLKSTREVVPERARRAFEEFDTDGDNQLDARELRHALRHYGIDLTSRQAARVLDAYDDRPDRRMDLTEFSNLVQDLELGLIRNERSPGPALAPGYAPAFAPAATAPGRPRTGGYRRPRTPGARPLAAFPSERPLRSSALDLAYEEDEDLALLYGRGLSETDDDSSSVVSLGGVTAANWAGARSRGRLQSSNQMLREQLRRERLSRRAAEVEAEAARGLALDARRRVDKLRLAAAERDLEGAMEERRRGLALSYEGDVRAPKDAKGSDEAAAPKPASPKYSREDLGGVAPTRPQVPERTRGHVMLLRDIHSLEASILNALDLKALSDSDAGRKDLLTRVMRSCSRHGDRFVNESEFALGIGKFSLGASARAGYRPAAPKHHVMQRPLDAGYDVSSDLVNALFARYCAPSGYNGERLVDVEALYGRLKRSVDPSRRLTRERTGLEMYVERADEELMNHPYGRH